MSPSLRTTEPLFVVQTYFVPNPGEDPHFEIQLAPDFQPKTPVSVFVTRDQALYNQAMACEGTSARVTLEYRDSTRKRLVMQGKQRGTYATLPTQVAVRLTVDAAVPA